MTLTCEPGARPAGELLQLDDWIGDRPPRDAWGDDHLTGGTCGSSTEAGLDTGHGEPLAAVLQHPALKFGTSSPTVSDNPMNRADEVVAVMGVGPSCSGY